jgi:hypothetical protein
MLTELELKKRLREIADAKYAVIDPAEHERLLEAMCAYIGVPDGELRDDLIYVILARWTLDGRLSQAQLRELLSTSLDDAHLFYRIGETGSDSVFTRSFSMLLLALIIYAHRQNAFLSKAEVLGIKDTVLEYIRREKDHRGYVGGNKGWAHAVAHTADVLDELALCSELGAQELSEILDAIGRLVAEEGSVYAYEEDERLSVATASVLTRQALDLKVWTQWIDRLVAEVAQEQRFMQGYNLRVNVKHFLRSLFFRLRRPEYREDLDVTLVEALVQIIDATLERVTK